MTFPPRPQSTQLANGDCVVAWLRPELVHGSRAIQECERILCSDELVRYRRFLRPADRHRFLVAHTLKRIWLSKFLQTPADRLRFEIDQFGKPSLLGDHHRRLAFNLSHTTGLVACAIADAGTVGIDVEDCSRAINIEIGKTVYSESEMNAMRALEECEQRNRFFQLWTYKEAYSKARGLGFQLPMKQCEFHFPPEQSVQPKFGADVHDDPSRWRFVSRLIEPNHRCAVAVPIERESPGRVDFYEFSERDLRAEPE
ncbi:4'-phosphopantetheinyl transferase family protein [Thalassoroseus pseudoceratinae]|uniref:4'-phosphopantetheinyl transferase family protein n=1 Tax=Thalassoroseus pseudoceratinae TaxID=2713176 RepID=UPI001422C875|nr:4'-phosphopantetheinyl transferase superfamily protein [Thalassoroseus pseudoceratinae]